MYQDGFEPTWQVQKRAGICDATRCGKMCGNLAGIFLKGKSRLKVFPARFPHIFAHHLRVFVQIAIHECVEFECVSVSV